MIKVEQWQPADGLTLETYADKAAREQYQSLVLTAGPGAGKTEMLAQRADFLLRTGVCRYPKRILAISFKVDASSNLRERVQRRCGTELARRFDSHTFHAFAKHIIDCFRTAFTGKDALAWDYKLVERKVAENEVEFDDLVPLATQILKVCPVARNALRQTYSDIFLDEFQDCTDKQYELIRVAFLGTDIRLTAVGDTKQRIMAWAGALKGVFEQFADDFNALRLNMFLNFRSKPKLRRLQNTIVKDLDPDSYVNEELLEGDDGEVLIERYPNPHEEAEELAKLIACWNVVDGIPYSEIAVLISKQLALYAPELMQSLERQGIPYRNEAQLQDLVSEPIFRLMVDYLLSLYGDKEPDAWSHLASFLHSLEDDIDPDRALKWGKFQRFFQKQRLQVVKDGSSSNPFLNWKNNLRAFVKHVGAKNFINLTADYENVDRLKDVMRKAASVIENELLTNSDLLKVLQSFRDDQAVRILTFHKSKGLEFDSVIIMAVEEEIFFGNPHENTCAFFVAVSRAKNRLVVTYTDYRPKPEGYTKHWDEQRTGHEQFLSYICPYTDPY